MYNARMCLLHLVTTSVVLLVVCLSSGATNVNLTTQDGNVVTQMTNTTANHKNSLPSVTLTSESSTKNISYDKLTSSTANASIDASEDNKNSSAASNASAPVLPLKGKSAELNIDAMKRASYVILVVTFVVIAYFVIRGLRLRGNVKARRYKIVSRKGDTEMAPLDQEEEEDDTTLFDANHPFIRQ